MSINWIITIYNFLAAHQTAAGYVLVAGVNALPVPGTGFNLYEFIYHWVRALTPLSHRQPPVDSPILNQGDKSEKA